MRSEPLPFDRSLLIRAFLLRHDPGNLLIYSTNGLQGQTDAIAGVGGVARHYLNHWHEAMFTRERVPAPLFVHENDSAHAGERTHVDGTFSARHAVDDDFEAIPIPGHTSGATAYLWENGGHRFLFTNVRQERFEAEGSAGAKRTSWDSAVSPLSLSSYLLSKIK